MNKLLLLSALALCSCGDHNPSWPFVADQPKATQQPLLIGTGQELRICNAGKCTVDVLIGPASIKDGDEAKMPIYVRDNVPFIAKTKPALGCLFFDEHQRLAGGRSSLLPPKLGAGNFDMILSRDITGGSVQCSLAMVSPEDRVLAQGDGQ
jgi:hypothetical protein